MMNEIERIKRTIHYYDLEFQFLDDFHSEDGDQFREIFKIIVSLAKTRANIRYQIFGEKSIFIQDIKFEPDSKIITGKLRCVRKDILPELMNTKTDEARGIDAKDEEGLVETTHFLIDYSKKRKKLAIEFNQFGAKIVDFINYIQNIGINKNAIKSVGFTPIVAGFENAKMGYVAPQGGSATAAEHNAGTNFNSQFTPWTTDKMVAENFALRPEGKGLLLEKDVPRSKVFLSPNKESVVLIQTGKKVSEKEVFVKGKVKSAKVCQVGDW